MSLSLFLKVSSLFLEWTLFQKGVFVSLLESQFLVFRVDPFSEGCVCLSFCQFLVFRVDSFSEGCVCLSSCQFLVFRVDSFSEGYVCLFLKVSSLFLEWIPFQKDVFVSLFKSQFSVFRVDPFSKRCFCLLF